MENQAGDGVPPSPVLSARDRQRTLMAVQAAAVAVTPLAGLPLAGTL